MDSEGENRMANCKLNMDFSTPGKFVGGGKMAGLIHEKVIPAFFLQLRADFGREK